jgi:hypothetical protein
MNTKSVYLDPDYEMLPPIYSIKLRRVLVLIHASPRYAPIGHLKTGVRSSDLVKHMIHF